MCYDFENKFVYVEFAYSYFHIARCDGVFICNRHLAGKCINCVYRFIIGVVFLLRL